MFTLNLIFLIFCFLLPPRFNNNSHLAYERQKSPGVLGPLRYPPSPPKKKPHQKLTKVMTYSIYIYIPGNRKDKYSLWWHKRKSVKESVQLKSKKKKKSLFCVKAIWFYIPLNFKKILRRRALYEDIRKYSNFKDNIYDIFFSK